MNVIRAELIKLTSIKSPIWCAVMVAVIGIGLAGLFGWVARVSRSDPETFGNQPIPFGVADALNGVSSFGVMVLMVLGALAITSEYRFGLIRTTFQAIPNRATVLIGKAAVYGVFGALVAVVTSAVAFLVARIFGGGELAAGLRLDSADTWREFFAVPIFAFLAVVLAVAVGALIRQSAAAIALLLLWPLLLESLVQLFGRFGREITPFLPFANANQFLGVESGVEFHWGPWGSLIYFVAVVAVVFAAAVVVVNRRDA